MIRVCAEPRCPDPATYRGRCQRHARANDKQINRAGRTLYNSPKWKATRKRKLFDDPLCERCGVIASDVHHKDDIASGANPWDLSRLESLCHRCHSRETRARMATR